MYKVEIPSDTLRDAAIRRRRQLDEERKKRIFDPKIRVLGIDVKALEEQIQIKNEMKRTEHEREEAFDRTMKATNVILEHLDAEAARKARQDLNAVNEFRAYHQQPWQRRDYDLYDPRALKNDRPARLGDEDDNIGPSSCQKFEGEDLASIERKRLQKEQMKVWAKQGVWERRMKQVEEAEEHRRYEEYQKEINDRLLAMTKSTEEAKQSERNRDRQINAELAALKRERENHQNKMDQEQNQREIMQQINGSFLTEQPDLPHQCASSRVRVDVFKGITAAQKQYIQQVQEQQRLEAEDRRARHKRDNKEFAAQEAANIRAAMLLEREKVRKIREEAIQLRRQNNIQSEEDKLKKFYTNKVLYTNAPTNEYFAQFNTTCR
ncbi:RIB43A-domain-containing protein [Phlyctochytrium arcticum]|nr:RIB43A-domain-containing protein [Phlyctochytrium arcticum]